LQSHYEATLKRIGEEKIVLVVQDTTSLNYSAHLCIPMKSPPIPRQSGTDSGANRQSEKSERKRRWDFVHNLMDLVVASQVIISWFF